MMPRARNDSNGTRAMWGAPEPTQAAKVTFAQPVASRGFELTREQADFFISEILGELGYCDENAGEDVLDWARRRIRQLKADSNG